MVCSPSSCKMWKNCFKVPRCFFFSKELMEKKGWVPRTGVEAQSFSAVPGAKLGGSAHPSCAGVAPGEWLLHSSRGGFGATEGLESRQWASHHFSWHSCSQKKENFEASEIQLLAGRLIPLMGPGSLLIILLIDIYIYIYMFRLVAVKGYVSLFEGRSTFLHKQKKSGDRAASTWQNIDRGEDNRCSRLTCSYFGERDASGVCVALGINIELIPVPHQEYLFTHKQPFCSFFLGYVFQVNSQQISISAFPTSHLPSGRIQLEKKNHILLVFESSSSSLPSPSSPSSLVPASWRRKEHINPKTALQPFLRYLPWGANWNWIRQGYQVCSLW